MTTKTEQCGCKIVHWPQLDAENLGIEHCPLHKAASELLEALEGIAEGARNGRSGYSLENILHLIETKARAAIESARS